MGRTGTSPADEFSFFARLLFLTTKIIIRSYGTRFRFRSYGYSELWEVTKYTFICIYYLIDIGLSIGMLIVHEIFLLFLDQRCSKYCDSVT